MTANNWCIFFLGGGGGVSFGPWTFLGFSAWPMISVLLLEEGGASFTPPRILRCDYLPPCSLWPLDLKISFVQLTYRHYLFDTPSSIHGGCVYVDVICGVCGTSV